VNKENRLRKNMEFKKVYKAGKNFWNRNLIVYVRRNGTDKVRIGVSITKKVGNAVVRNKLKRRIREINRLYLPYLRPGYDIVIIPKKNAVDLLFTELESALKHIYKLSGVAEKVK
jgi:ribonuclease P protein component